jgi:Fe-S cluster biogenesis protein NfuA
MGDPAARGLDEPAVQELLEQVEELLGRLEQMPGPTAETGLDAVAALSELYGEALRRVVQMVSAADASDPLTTAALASEELIGHLLLLHGLHPVPVEQRVARAIDEVRLQLGGGVELTGIESGVAQVSVTVSGCSSSTEGLLSAVADAVLAAAPELTAVEPVGVKPAAATPLIPVESLLQRPVAVR